LFVKNWISFGYPTSYWLPGIFFTQGFLTGTLQVHARKYDLPIDELSFEFFVVNNYRDEEKYQELNKTLEFGQQNELDKEVNRLMALICNQEKTLVKASKNSNQMPKI
jgi:dynein heavy chain